MTERKFEGIDKIVSETKSLRGPYGNHIQIDYHLEDDRLIREEFADGNSYITYQNPDIIHVATVCNPLTKSELIRMVTQAVEDHFAEINYRKSDAYRKYWEDQEMEFQEYMRNVVRDLDE